MGRRVNVIGVGMTKFQKPGASDEYNVMAVNAARAALADAKIDYKEVESAYVGYVYGDSTCGQRAVYELGTTGIPVFNVNNNCSTGSSALMLAKQAVEGGLVECALALAKDGNLRDHYQRGQVRIDGNAHVASKLNFFKGLV